MNNNFTSHNLIAKNEAETIKFAQDFANKILAQSINHLICLSGPMGAGKSVFARSFIQHVFQDKNMEVPSPTFTLVQQYERETLTLWHFDLYRLEHAEEIYEIGWEEATMQTSYNIALIEWPERIESLLPNPYTHIDIKPLDETQRQITITDHK